MTTPNKDREAFEAWNKNKAGCRFDLTRCEGSEQYASMTTEYAFMGYQAACAEKDEVIAELEAQLEATKRESGSAVCHQLREAIMHLTHEEVFDKESAVIKEMEAAINTFNGWTE